MTPRTDAETVKYFESQGVSVWDYEEMRQLACDLERELAAANSRIEELEEELKIQLDKR